MDFKSPLLSAASALGRGEQALSLYSRISSWPDYIPDIDPTIRSFSLPEEEVEGSVFMPAVEGSRNPYFHCLLAHSFRTRGYEPLLLWCDRDLPLCFQKEFGDDTVACDKCRFHGTTLLDKFGLNPVPIAEYANDTSPTEVVESAADTTDVTYAGVNVSEFALSSTRRFLQKNHLDLADKWEKEVYESFLQSGVLLAGVTDSFIESRDDIVAAVGMDGAYVYGGLPQHVARQHGIPVHAYSVGYTDGTLLVGNEKIRSPMFTDPAVVDEFLATPLSEPQQGSVDEMMRGRRDGSKVRVKWAGESSERLGETTGTTVSMFTNLMWDASLEVDYDAAFDTAYDWVRTTIDKLGGRNDLTLVIKTHPAESVRGANETMVDWIEATYDSLPENVIVLEPDTEVGPYRLLEATDHALVWNSTIGLEAAFEGIPTVVSGVAHYRGFDFTFDADNPAEYRSLLADFDREMTEEMRRRARRYAYFLFIAKQIEFPFFETIDGDRRFKPVSHDQLTPGNENIDAIVNGILNDETVMRLPAERAKQSQN